MVTALFFAWALAAEPEPAAEAATEEAPSEEATDGTEVPAEEAPAEGTPAPVPTLPSPSPTPVEQDDATRAAAAEARRLRGELVKVARAGRHDAVDRLYKQLVELGQPIPNDIHTYAADAAMARGDLMHCVARLHRAGGGDQLVDVTNRYGAVRLSLAAPGAQVQGAERFAPDERMAVSFVNTQLATDGRFVGMLPAGEYEVAGRPLIVPAGGSVAVVVD
jgi:hypothetical protein